MPRVDRPLQARSRRSAGIRVPVGDTPSNDLEHVSSDKETLVVAFLDSEIDSAAEMVRTIVSGYDRWLAATAAIIIGGTIALREARAEIVLIALPFPVFLILLLSGSHLIELHAQAGHRHYLEARTQRVLRSSMALWESSVARRIYRLSPTNNVLLPGSYLLGYTIILAVSVEASAGAYKSWLPLVLGFGGISLAALLLMLLEMMTAHKRAHDIAWKTDSDCRDP